jgi:hypothetical protein
MEKADFMAEKREDLPVASTDLRHTASLVPTLVHSAALIMEESREASPLAGSPASVGASMAAEAFTVAVVVTAAVAAGSSVALLQN